MYESLAVATAWVVQLFSRVVESSAKYLTPVTVRAWSLRCQIWQYCLPHSRSEISLEDAQKACGTL